MNKAEREHIEAVKNLGCYACLKIGYETPDVQIHHIRSGIGKGQRATHFQTIPLCPIHHLLGEFGVAFHSGPREWQKNFGNELDIVEEINNLVIRKDK